MNLTEIFNQENKKIELKLAFPFEEFMDETIKNEADVELVLSNIGKGKAVISGKVSLDFVLSCDRCLKPVETTVVLDFSREIFAPEMLDDEDMKEDQHFIDEYELDVESLLKEELQLAWPSKILCDEECKGICKKCGQNLNDGTCECDDFVPDIRFANLMDIFNSVKE
ncbi:MAG: DUF177 domain-containing protein [Lachnospiraceae bacterium]|nr:DUF177 domain-containing protein [Lachnospiraceae bacterium]